MEQLRGPSLIFYKSKTISHLITTVFVGLTKINSVNRNDLKQVNIFLKRRTMHGQKKMQDLIGITDKRRIRFILSIREKVEELKAEVAAFDRKVAEFNNKLDSISTTKQENSAINFEELRNLETELKAMYKLLCKNWDLFNWPPRSWLIINGEREPFEWRDWHPPVGLNNNGERFEVCGNCKTRIRTCYKERELTKEELEEEIEFKKIDDAKEPYYCTSSFCGYGTCNRCEDNDRKVIPATKMTYFTKTCSCGTTTSELRSNRSYK